MLNSAIDQLGPPDIELTPNSIMTNLTEHYVPNSVTRVREHKNVSHVPNISLLNKGRPAQRSRGPPRRPEDPGPGSWSLRRSPPRRTLEVASPPTSARPGWRLSEKCQLNVRKLRIFWNKIGYPWWLGGRRSCLPWGCLVAASLSSPCGRCSVLSSAAGCAGSARARPAAPCWRLAVGWCAALAWPVWSLRSVSPAPRVACCAALCWPAVQRCAGSRCLSWGRGGAFVPGSARGRLWGFRVRRFFSSLR